MYYEYTYTLNDVYYEHFYYALVPYSSQQPWSMLILFRTIGFVLNKADVQSFEDFLCLLHKGINYTLTRRINFSGNESCKP
jgi:hypothetical protein